MTNTLAPDSHASPEQKAQYDALVAEEKREARSLPDGELEALRIHLDRTLRMWAEDGLDKPHNDWLRQWAALRLRIITEEISWRKQAASRGGPAFDARSWDEYLDTVRQRVDLPVIVMLLGVHVEEKRGSWWGACPFHGEKTPSFHVDADQKLWHCFGCNLGGDVFTFLELRRGDDFSAALQWLAELYRVERPKPTPKPIRHFRVWKEGEVDGAA